MAALLTWSKALFSAKKVKKFCWPYQWRTTYFRFRWQGFSMFTVYDSDCKYSFIRITLFWGLYYKTIRTCIVQKIDWACSKLVCFYNNEIDWQQQRLFLTYYVISPFSVKYESIVYNSTGPGACVILSLANISKVCKVETKPGWALTWLSNIKFVWKSLPRTNALAFLCWRKFKHCHMEPIL